MTAPILTPEQAREIVATVTDVARLRASHEALRAERDRAVAHSTETESLYYRALAGLDPAQKCCTGETPLINGHSVGCPAEGARRLREERDEYREKIVPSLHTDNAKLRAVAEAARKWLADIRRRVDRQAADESLWYPTRDSKEAYLQQELRRLHAVIDGDDFTIAALATLDEVKR